MLLAKCFELIMFGWLLLRRKDQQQKYFTWESFLVQNPREFDLHEKILFQRVSIKLALSKLICALCVLTRPDVEGPKINPNAQP